MKELKTGSSPTYIKNLLTIARILVGVLFIFSGVVKADDPLGLSYKMQEFFEAWGWSFLNDFSLVMSILMIAFEIIAGVAVLLGWRMKLFSWLLLLLILFFTFLTSYVVFSGKIRTCGCFGDCIPLTPYQTFTKDIILTLLIFFIFRNRASIHPLFKPAISVALLLVAIIFAFASQAYMLRYLPVVDCMPLKIGKNIPAQIVVPPDAPSDSIVTTLTFLKNGKEVKIISPNFPADYNDSLYHQIDRHDEYVRKRPDPAVNDFLLRTLSGNDTTTDVIARNGYSLLFFIREMPGDTNQLVADYSWLNDNFRANKKGAFVIITSRPDEVRNVVGSKSPYGGNDVLSCDFVAVRVACRSNAVLYLIKDGNILNKWSFADFDKAQKAIAQLP